MERWHLFYKKPFKSKSGNDFYRNWWISDHGQVKWTYDHNDKEIFIEPKQTGGHASSGRYQALSINDAPEKYVHRLVARYFVPNPSNEPTVNHKDGNKMNNHYTNLEWISNQENVIHGMKTRGTFNQETYDRNKRRKEMAIQNAARREVRMQQHLTLHAMGMKTKDIAAITGASYGTVRNDIKKQN